MPWCILRKIVAVFLRLEVGPRRTITDRGENLPNSERVNLLGCRNLRVLVLRAVKRRRFILGWKTPGYEKRFAAKIVNYADDFVICCRGQANSAMDAMRDMMRKLKLTVNEEKTHICQLPDEAFDFLGYTFGRCYSKQTGVRYIGQRPSKKKVQAICRQISEYTSARRCWLDVEEQINRLNRVMVGWANHFCLGPVAHAYRWITQHARQRLRQWLRKKHKLRTWGYSHFPDEYLHEESGLVQLRLCDRNVPWAKA